MFIKAFKKTNYHIIYIMKCKQIKEENEEKNMDMCPCDTNAFVSIC